MPLPMIHLAVAVQVCALIGREVTPAFVLGSLAPDAIHMRARTNREDKDRVHLNITRGNESQAIDQIGQLLIEHRGTADLFTQGYAAHLLTDYWWVQEYARPFFDSFPQDTSPEERRAWYYRETDQVDFNLYNRAPWRRRVWDLLAAADAPEFPPYLAAEEIDRWRERTLDWFEKSKKEPGIEPQLLTEKNALEFIKDSSLRVCQCLYRKT